MELVAVVWSIIRALDPGMVTLALEGPASYRDTFELALRRTADRPNAMWQALQRPAAENWTPRPARRGEGGYRACPTTSRLSQAQAAAELAARIAPDEETPRQNLTAVLEAQGHRQTAERILREHVPTAATTKTASPLICPRTEHIIDISPMAHPLSPRPPHKPDE